MQVEENKENIQGINVVTDQIKNAIDQKYDILDSGFVNLSIGVRGNDVRFSIQSPNSKDRINHDIVCVLDVSFSMCQQAQVKNKAGEKEGHGLSYLDILKHAVNTVINNLNENDRFGLVSYSDTATVNFELNNMTKQNKLLATEALMLLDADGQTNIWAGIEAAMSMLLKNKQNNMHQSIILLTDGEPNVFPPKGWIPTLNDYKAKHKNECPALNCYAFGKQIDSVLLDSLALNGNGVYSFIPCPGFVGTIFVNSISNILCTMGNEVEIELEPINGTKIQHIFGCYPKEGKDPSKKWLIHAGDLKFGQTKDLLFQVEQQDQSLPMLNIKLKYYDYLNQQYRISEIKEWTRPIQEDLLVDKDFCRLFFVDHVRHAFGIMKKSKHEEAKKAVLEIEQRLKKVLEKLKGEMAILSQEKKEFELGRAEISVSHIENLLKDVEGEVTLAFKQQYSFDHWGQHYIPSLSQAHLKQQCNNFIDPGIQEYGGALFKEIRDEAEKIFLKLPAPKKFAPKKVEQNYDEQQQQQAGQQKQRQRSPSPVDMAVYYNASGGCFEGNCVVKMIDGSNKKINELKKGDILANNNLVKALIKINNGNNQEIELVSLAGGLLITPKHPILINGEWMKPYELGEVKKIQCQEVFNVVLNKGHTIIVNGFECATLGHGFKAEKAKHEYFGTEKIIEDLRKCKGYEDQGLVEISMNQFVRDQVTNQVVGISTNH